MKTVRDEALTQALRARLGEDMRTSGQTIEIIVAEDEIILFGWCDSEEQRQVAEQIASGFYGVRSVTTKINVRRIAQSI